MLGGAAVAVWGALPGLDAGFQRAAPILGQLGKMPIGLWTLQFLFESIFGALVLIVGEILNKTAVIGAVIFGVGYFMHPDSKARASNASKATASQ